MKLLYGTGNPAKAAAMQNRIAGLGIELISLQDLRAQGVEIPRCPGDRQYASGECQAESACLL